MRANDLVAVPGVLSGSEPTARGTAPRPRRWSLAAAADGARAPRAPSAAGWTCGARRRPPAGAAERRRAGHAAAAATPPTGAARRLPGGGARSGAFEERERARGGAGPAQPDLRAPRAGHHRRAPPCDFPNSDRRTTTCSRSRRPKRFDLGRYPTGRSQVGALRPPGRGARLLRHPLAHERVHPGLRPPLLRRDRRRGRATGSTACPPGTYTPGGLERRAGAARRARSRCPRRAAVERTSCCK